MFLTRIFLISATCKHADSYYIFVPIYGMFLSLNFFLAFAWKWRCVCGGLGADCTRAPGAWGPRPPAAAESAPSCGPEGFSLGDLLCKWSQRLLALCIFLNCRFTYWPWRGEKVKSAGWWSTPYAETFLRGPARSVESQYFRNFHADLELTLLYSFKDKCFKLLSIFS